MQALLALLLSAVAVAVASAADPCSSSACGVNTKCELNHGGLLAVCRCLDGWIYEPGKSTLDGCPVPIAQRGPARCNSGCRTMFNIQGPPQRERRPCSGNPCGVNADCREQGPRAVCSCPQGYHGDPYVHCLVDPCHPNPCGQGAQCESNGDRAICKCPRGWSGEPLVRCIEDPCSDRPCGANADCFDQGGVALCKCRPNYEGDPYVTCALNPCLRDPCGINADCQKNGPSALCTCRQGYTGNPFQRCTRDPCFDDPCGPNAHCQARGEAAVCTCPPGYSGDAFDRFRGCLLNPCSGNPCGSNAECESSGRIAICKCPKGYAGDPYTVCIQDPCSAGGVCGEQASCENVSGRAVCKCPPQHTGDPYIRCTLDPCASNNPCGQNTECEANGRRPVCRCVPGFTGSPYSRSGCAADPCSIGSPCGQNAMCESIISNRPVCKCPSGYTGDPYQMCIRGECSSNSQCPNDKACDNFKCVDPCVKSCGTGADCTARNHVAICRCPSGNTGNPFESCRKLTMAELCKSCGVNSDCEIGPNDTPICKCKPNFVGNPLTGCRRECDTSVDCSSSDECSNFRCVPCCREGVCGENANCQPSNNRAICTCPPDFLGDGYSRCYTECTRHEDCAQNRACVRFQCKDPCLEPDPNVCGQGANCQVKNHQPICSCPRGYTGDPFKFCRQFTLADLCTPNPCGEGAQCQPGKDNLGEDRPVCTCPRGFNGDPLRQCTKGQCQSDRDCGSERKCLNYECKDPCLGACAPGANCKSINHGALCSCPRGYIGDPLTYCRPS